MTSHDCVGRPTHPLGHDHISQKSLWDLTRPWFKQLESKIDYILHSLGDRSRITRRDHVIWLHNTRLMIHIYVRINTRTWNLFLSASNPPLLTVLDFEILFQGDVALTAVLCRSSCMETLWDSGIIFFLETNTHKIKCRFLYQCQFIRTWSSSSWLFIDISLTHHWNPCFDWEGGIIVLPLRWII